MGTPAHQQMPPEPLNLAVVRPEEFQRRGETLLERAQALVIDSWDACNQAEEELIGVVTLRKRIVEHHKPIKQAIDESKRVALEQEHKALDPVLAAEKVYRDKTCDFKEVARLAKEENERLARIEEQRLADEAQERAIMDAEENGASAEEVQAIIETPFVAPRVAPEPTRFGAPRQLGTGRVSAPIDNWSGACDNLDKLIEAAYADRILRGLLQVNQPALNKLAAATRKNFNVPGCRAVNNPTQRVAPARR